MARAISKAEYETLATFRYALRQFVRFSETAAREAGITPKQHQALLAIAGFPGRDQITMGELAERLQIRHHSTVELIDRLAAQSLVAREPGVPAGTPGAAKRQDRRGTLARPAADFRAWAPSCDEAIGCSPRPTWGKLMAAKQSLSPTRRPG